MADLMNQPKDIRKRGDLMPRGKPFAKGYDPRRKLLTQDDRRRGYANAPSRIKARIRGLYRGGKIVKRGETVYEELAL